jgi:cytochrome P450
MEVSWFVLLSGSAIIRLRQVASRWTSRITRCGTGLELFPDYITGLGQICDRIGPSRLGSLDMFGTEVLLVMKPSHVTTVLTSTVEHALHGLRPASIAFFGKKVLFVLHGAEWKSLRNLMKICFQRHNLKLMVDDVFSVAGSLSACLSPFAKQTTQVDMLQAVSMFHLSAIGKSAFNQDLKCMENFEQGPNEITKSFEFMLSELPRRAFSQDPETQNDYETPNEDNRKWQLAATTVREVISSVIKKRLDDVAKGTATSNTARDGDLLAAMINGHGSTDPSVLTEELGDNLIEILFAGYNTGGMYATYMRQSCDF